GTPMDALFEAVCEGFYLTSLDDVRASFIGRLSHSDVSSVFAVMRGGTPFGSSPGGYIVSLTPTPRASATAEPQYWFLTTNGRIEGVSGGCGPAGAALAVKRQTSSANFVVGPFISCSPPSGENADLFVNVEGLSPGGIEPMFWGPARATPDGPPLE